MHVGVALLSAMALSSPAHQASAPATCPAGAPTQAIAVIDQAGVRPATLAKVENALVAQSLQLRASWGTPCVTFAPGGWPFYLQTETGGWTPGGEHYAPNYTDGTSCGQRQDLSTPCALISVDYGHGPWTDAFSHELMETLADPTNLGDEVCDPVDGSFIIDRRGMRLAGGYMLDGVTVSDFVTPAWFDGGPGPYDWTQLVRRPGGTP